MTIRIVLIVLAVISFLTACFHLSAALDFTDLGLAFGFASMLPWKE